MGPLASGGRPCGPEYVVKTGSRQRSMPRSVPTHRLPSRSSKVAVTCPSDHPASAAAWHRCRSGLTRSSPRAPAAIHRFDSRSRIRRQRRHAAQRRRHARLGDLRPVPPRHAAIRPDPHLAAWRGEQAVDLQVGQAVGMATELRAANPEQAGIAGAEPDRTVGGFDDRDDERRAGQRALGPRRARSGRRGRPGRRGRASPAASRHRGHDPSR